MLYTFVAYYSRNCAGILGAGLAVNLAYVQVYILIEAFELCVAFVHGYIHHHARKTQMKVAVATIITTLH